MGNCMFNIKNYLLLTLVVSFSAFNVEVFSQDESADIEEVVTTGSRIARPEVCLLYTSPSPRDDR